MAVGPLAGAVGSVALLYGCELQEFLLAAGGITLGLVVRTVGRALENRGGATLP